MMANGPLCARRDCARSCPGRAQRDPGPRGCTANQTSVVLPLGPGSSLADARSPGTRDRVLNRRRPTLRLDRPLRQISRAIDLLRRELVARHLDVLVDEVDGVLHALGRDVAEAVLLDVGRD